jgi:hypothetical protein
MKKTTVLAWQTLATLAGTDAPVFLAEGPEPDQHARWVIGGQLGGTPVPQAIVDDSIVLTAAAAAGGTGRLPGA